MKNVPFSNLHGYCTIVILAIMRYWINHFINMLQRGKIFWILSKKVSLSNILSTLSIHIQYMYLNMRQIFVLVALIPIQTLLKYFEKTYVTYNIIPFPHNLSSSVAKHVSLTHNLCKKVSTQRRKNRQFLYEKYKRRSKNHHLEKHHVLQNNAI